MNAPRLPKQLLKYSKNDIYKKKDNIKQYLLQLGGFKTIQEAKRILGAENIQDVYEPLLDNYNSFVEQENKILMKKYNEDYKVYQKEKLRLYNEQVKKEVREKLIKKKETAKKNNEKRRQKNKNRMIEDGLGNMVEFKQVAISYKLFLKDKEEQLKTLMPDDAVIFPTFENFYHEIIISHADYLLDVIKMARRVLHGKRIFLGIADKIYTLSNKFIKDIEELKDQVTNGVSMIEADHFSGGVALILVKVAVNFSIFYTKEEHSYKKSSGSFFPYYNKTDLNLNDYGIFNYEETMNNFLIKGFYYDDGEKIDIKQDICLIHALKMGGLDNERLEILRNMVTHSNIPLCKLNEICQELKICIEIKRETKNSGRDIYGKENKEVYKIGLLEDHYFILKDAGVTSYSIENYDDVKNINDWFKIDKKTNGKYKKSNQKSINSYQLIKLLLENKEKLLTPIPYEDIMKSSYHKRFENDITNLKYNESKLKLVEKPKVKSISNKVKKEIINVFFDFETYNKKINNKANDEVIPYLCCIKSNEIKRYFTGEKCGYDMLEFLYENFDNKKQEVRLIAHNATFDFRFIVKYLYGINEIAKGSRMISCNGIFKKLKIYIKCSYHLISAPLKNFGKMFKLEQGKEIMPYDLYNENGAIDQVFFNIDYVLNKYINENDKKQFLNNLDKWNLRTANNEYDIITYSRYYCEIDCDVLEKGYNIFRSWILDLQGYDLSGKLVNHKLDINEILTSASLAHRFMVMNDCYDGVYEMSSTPQQFIQKCVVGGRTMMRNNQKEIINDNGLKSINNKIKRNKKIFYGCENKNIDYKKEMLNEIKQNVRKIADFDGVSLYPSAMYRMDGFLKGKPNVITDFNYETIKNYDGYFVKIHIHNIPIPRSFPLASYVNDEGVRRFENEIKNDIYVDKIQLEDLIEFHGLKPNDFTILQGYYFNNGFNKQINKNIKYLFDKRKELKKAKNPAQEIYKLIMNSAYGKSIMKEILNEYKIFENEKDYKIFVSRNYEWIEEIITVPDSEIKRVKMLKPISEHSNICQVGSSVLSWSKRIMNEVMCLAEDNNIPIFYQDTDSMHMYQDEIKLLGELFKEKYGRELIGEELGQFHSDFEIPECENVYSKKLITLGKKSYCDVLVGTNKITGKEETQEHIRLKGIPNSCIFYTQKLLGYKSVIDMYEDLYYGKEITFDLTEGKLKTNFKMCSDYSIQNISIFDRKLTF